MFKPAIVAASFLVAAPSAPSLAASAYAVGTAGPRSWGAGGFDHTDFSQAQRHALQMCSRGGPGCGIVALFSDACFALAAQLGGPGYTAMVRPTLTEARQTAMMRCLSHGRPCGVRASYCDFSRASATDGWSDFPRPAPRFRPPASGPDFRRPCDGDGDLCEYK